MSFLDQLAKNLNSQTEFFAQLSNISKDSRANVDRKPELQVKQKSELNLEKRSSNETHEVSKKEEFQIKEKEGFFTTAKKVFKEYKVKADTKTKEKEEPKLEDELETADQALDLIFGLVDPQLQAQIELQQAEISKPDLSAALQALEVKPTAQEPDPELLDFFLDRIDLKINSEIETLTKEIINLDLNTDEGVTEILEISNSIETLQNVEKAIEEIKTDLKALINQETTKVTDKEIKPELEVLLESKIDTKLKELKQVDLEQTVEVKLELKAEPKEQLAKPELIKPELVKPELVKPETIKPELIKPEPIKTETKPQAQLQPQEAQITLEEADPQTIKKVLDEVKASLKQERAVKDTSLNKPETNTNTFDVKVFKETELRTETNKTLDYTKAEVELLEASESSSSDTQKDSDFGNENFETLFPREIKVSNIKIKTLTKPVALKQLPEVVTKEAQNVKPGAKQEVKMILDPENLGKMQLSLTREDNQIHISMIVRTDEAQTKLEQKINDIKLALKEKGFEANIEVNKSDTNNSNQAGQNQGQARQGNEAKEEQKEKYLNQVPEWISKDAEKLDFTEALNRAL